MVFSNMKKAMIAGIFLIALAGTIQAQEALKSHEEEYYDFLALRGLAERPSLNYRTLSDSVWAVSNEAHPWQDQNLGKRIGLFGDAFMKIYGPELFMSANTAAPYGQNDGALWQGRGFNASFSGGLRLEGYGLELTFKPQLAFSQNLAFEIMKSSYDSEYGYFWAYDHNTGIDAPQRFGDKPFFTYDWGDSEARYTWKTLTIGFGTQAVWLGPAHLNPILHSNNAAGYPKLDIGLRRQPITIPGVNWYMGDVEFRLWTGYLSESEYFDDDPENDHTMFHGLSFAYAPSFLPGLTLSANRVCLIAWEWENLKYIFPSQDNTKEDQKASFGLSYQIPRVGFEVYGELGVDDFLVGGLIGYLRYPFHTMVYTAGLKKTITFTPKVYGVFLFEWNNMNTSIDYQFINLYSFYFHHVAKQGYTNRGQTLGSGSAWGGNNQFLRFDLYYPQGLSSIFVQRNNPDDNYVIGKAVNTSNVSFRWENWTANFNIGASTLYYLTKDLSLGGAIIYNLIINPAGGDRRGNDDIFMPPADGRIPDENIEIYQHNFSLNFFVKYSF
jgi:hypothetical protein